MRVLADKILPDQTGHAGEVLTTDGNSVSWAAGGGGGLTTEQIQDMLSTFLVAGTNITLTYNDGADTLTIAASGGGGNSVTASLDFGASWNDKAQTVVTGQTWVTTNSEIIAQVLCPSGTDPDEIRLLELKPVISDLVAGTGFTVTLYSEPEAKGTYSVMCVGV